jgi:hypothetical protein
MNKVLFMKIVHVVRELNVYFLSKDSTQTIGFSSIHNCTAAMRLIAYGAPGDSKDEYLRMDVHCH